MRLESVAGIGANSGVVGISSSPMLMLVLILLLALLLVLPVSMVHRRQSQAGQDGGIVVDGYLLWSMSTRMGHVHRRLLHQRRGRHRRGANGHHLGRHGPAALMDGVDGRLAVHVPIRLHIHIHLHIVIAVWRLWHGLHHVLMLLMLLLPHPLLDPLLPPRGPPDGGLLELPRRLDLADHVHLPLPPGRLVQPQGGDGVLLGIVALPQVLDLHLALVPHQIAQLGRQQDVLVGVLGMDLAHEGGVLGGIPHVGPGVGHVQRRKVGRQAVANQDLAVEDPSDLGAALVEGDGGGIAVEVVGGNARHEGAVIRHGLGYADELVQHDVLVVVDQNDAGEGVVGAIGADADHLAIHGEVNVGLGHGGVVRGAGRGERVGPAGVLGQVRRRRRRGVGVRSLDGAAAAAAVVAAVAEKEGRRGRCSHRSRRGLSIVSVLASASSASTASSPRRRRRRRRRGRGATRRNAAGGLLLRLAMFGGGAGGHVGIDSEIHCDGIVVVRINCCCL